MSDIEFKEFGKIDQIGKLHMSITEKLHGTHAQIYIFKKEDETLDMMVGSRNRWLMPTDDNFNFAKFCYENREEIIAKLGEGRHYGEWIGSGINAGYGLKEKRFVLFNWARWIPKGNDLDPGALELPARISFVPPLYCGKISMEVINEVMDDLKQNGSKFVPGWMKPEGIVINVGGHFYKKVFEDETVAWKKKEKSEYVHVAPDVSHLLQPLRLEKILSRDEKFLREYPSSISTICSEYVNDLEKEGQLTGNEEEIKILKKSLGRYVYPFIKSIVSGILTHGKTI